MYYYFAIEGLVGFQDRIYVLDNSELKKVILREFQEKPYSGHLGYHTTLTIVNKIYYWLNLKRDVT